MLKNNLMISKIFIMVMFLNYSSFAVNEIIWEKRRNIFIFFNIKKIAAVEEGI